MAGPGPGDFSGLPLNADGRAHAQSYSPSQLSMPERQCLYYPQTYRVVGPFGPRVWPEYGADGNVLAWRMNGAVDMTPRTIWMDGRPIRRRPPCIPTKGFPPASGRGRTLVVTTTHMKEGPLRRNGVFHSDNAVMTEFIIRHDDMLTLTAIVDDPTVLDEPHIISRTFVNDPTLPAPIVGNPCTPIIEAPGLDRGDAPLPARSESVYRDMVKICNYRESDRRRWPDVVPGIPRKVAAELHPTACLWPLLLRLGRRKQWRSWDRRRREPLLHDATIALRSRSPSDPKVSVDTTQLD